MTSALPTTRGRLSELAVVFLRLGILGFGGPAAHIAMMRDEVVRRRRWMTDQMFLDLVAATNLIPGPNSTEMAIHIGYARAGWRGLLVAGACFIIPAMVIVMVFAWAYTRYGTVPAAVWLLYGIKPVIIAVIAQALWSLGRTAVRGWGGCPAGNLWARAGSGLFPPVRSSPPATFIGSLLGGLPGAAVATAAIFLPAFVFVAASHPFIPRLRRSPWAGALLDGVNVTSLALMAGVTWQLGRVAVTDVTTAVLAVVSAGLLIKYRVNSAWLVVAGAAIGVARLWVR